MKMKTRSPRPSLHQRVRVTTGNLKGKLGTVVGSKIALLVQLEDELVIKDGEVEIVEYPPIAFKSDEIEVTANPDEESDPDEESERAV